MISSIAVTQDGALFMSYNCCKNYGISYYCSKILVIIVVFSV